MKISGQNIGSWFQNKFENIKRQFGRFRHKKSTDQGLGVRRGHGLFKKSKSEGIRAPTFGLKGRLSGSPKDPIMMGKISRELERREQFVISETPKGVSDVSVGIGFAEESTESKIESTYPKSTEERRFPPRSLVDTIVFGGFDKYDARVFLFRSDEILELHQPKESGKIGDHLVVDFNEEGKVVIQQQANRGCTAAVAAMLIHDAGKTVDTHSLYSTNLGDTDTISMAIKKAGLKPKVNKLPFLKESTLEDLRDLITESGSAIVSTGRDIGGHVIVVDHISEDLSEVTLRDPYHGWEITVTDEAFMKGWGGGDVIQLAKEGEVSPVPKETPKSAETETVSVSEKGEPKKGVRFAMEETEVIDKGYVAKTSEKEIEYMAAMRKELGKLVNELSEDFKDGTIEYKMGYAGWSATSPDEDPNTDLPKVLADKLTKADRILVIAQELVKSSEEKSVDVKVGGETITISTDGRLSHFVASLNHALKNL